VLDGLLPEGHSTFHNNPAYLHGTAGGNYGTFYTHTPLRAAERECVRGFRV